MDPVMRRPLSFLVVMPLVLGAAGWAPVNLVAHTTQAATGAWRVAALPTPDRSGWPFVPGAVDCPAAGTCYVAGDTFVNWAGYPAVDTLAQGRWSTTGFPSVSGGVIQATITDTLACLSVTFCMAAGSGGPGNNQQGEYALPYLLVRSKGTWKFTQPLKGFVNDLTCAGGEFCVGVGYDLACTGPPAGTSCTDEELIETYIGGRWTARRAPLAAGQSAAVGGELWHVSCPRPGWCVAIGGAPAAVLTLSNGRWTARRAPLPVSHSHDAYLSDLACPAVNRCVVVGTYMTGAGHGVITHPLFLAKTPAGWRTATLPAGSYSSLAPDRVRCPTVRLCFAAGIATAARHDYMVGFHASGGRWAQTVLPTSIGSTETQAGDFSGMACASPKSCLAAGAAGSTSAWSLAFESGRWQADRIPSPLRGRPASTPSVTDVTVDGSGYVAVGTYCGCGDSNNYPDGKGMVAFHG
jgi:hypothetical protein